MFGAGQGLLLSIVDPQSNTVVRTINFGPGIATYVDSNFVFDSRAYRMTLTPHGLNAGESAIYWASFALSPVPEPITLQLALSGLTLVLGAVWRRSVNV
jgi:hypothetical protein